MNKEFVTYEIAEKLKELGFDEECICLYDTRNKNNYLIAVDQHWGSSLIGICKKDGFRINDYEYPAPLYQQVIDWLRVEHNLSMAISEGFEDNKGYFYVDFNHNDEYIEYAKWHESYEIAREKGIIRAIQLIKK